MTHEQYNNLSNIIGKLEDIYVELRNFLDYTDISEEESDIVYDGMTSLDGAIESLYKIEK